VAEKLAVLDAAAADGVTAAAEKFGTSRWSIYDWQRRKQTATTLKEAEHALAPRSSAPKHNARRLPEKRYHLIAETWLKNQALGPRQVRNKMRRDHGLRVGTSTARRVMEEHGYVPPKVTVERRIVSRYEAVRPNQQVHLDFLHFFVHKAKAYLLLIEDDYSRFLTGWALCEGERAQPVIEAVDEAISRHGKPEQMVVDGGSGFFSWRGQSQLERACGDYGIDFIKASKKGSNSKLEALNANVRKELLSRVEFADLADARQQIARWVYTYNFERVHEGLGGLLVPADRYFGRSQEVLAPTSNRTAPGSYQGRTAARFRPAASAPRPSPVPAVARLAYPELNKLPFLIDAAPLSLHSESCCRFAGPRRQQLAIPRVVTSRSTNGPLLQPPGPSSGRDG
jgi:transposase InsO family protein